jgi:SAM-dependent methyltransferase
MGRDEVWKERSVAEAFIERTSVHIPDRPRQLEVLLRLVRSVERSVERVLDLGAGDGFLLATVLDALPEARGVAVDFSSPMLERARAKLARFGPRAATAEADLASPEWRSEVEGPFDAVVSGFAIHHLTDLRKRELYGEIYELVVPGGLFCNTEHVASATPGVEELFNDAMIDHLYESRRGRGESVTRARVRREFLDRPDRAANILASVEAQCGWLREIGFRDVDCFWKYFELAIFGGFRPR